jgi:acyl-CoA synthetase (AMP-forming)/AMP-acid ligase II
VTPALWDHLVFQARQRPSAPAVFDPAGPIAFHSLVRDVAGMATELLERGIGRSDMVALDLGFSYRHLILILALDRLSIPSLSLVQSDPPPPAAALRARLGATVVISRRAAPAAEPADRWIVMDERARPQPCQPDLARLAAIDSPADALVRVIWSSGTTGEGKGAPIGRTIQAHRLSARRMVRGLGPRTRYFTGAPFSASPGYIMALATLAAGGSVVLPDPAVDFFSRANALGVTATSASPAMLAELISHAPTCGLETMDMLMVSGAPLTSQLVRQTRLALTPNLWTGYGTTEIDGIAQVDTTVTLDDPSAVGFTYPWVDVEIVDPADRKLPPGREGVLRVRSPQTIAGYHDDDAATRQHFRDRWFYPGDVGTISPEGLLRITGRVEDMIVRDGVGIAPQPIEAAITALPQVRDAAVFAMPRSDGAQEIWAAVVLESGADPRAIADAVKLGDRTLARLLVIDRLPRNANGKVMRRVLIELARSRLS